MDFDATSNLSQISNQSDDIKSTISSISGLSTYQDEFVELRHLVSPERYSESLDNRPQASTPVNDSGCDIHNEGRIADLSYQLQSTLKQNEHYKNQLFNLEMKLEVKYHDKVERLLKTNNQLEIEVMKANEQIQRLIKHYAKDLPKLEEGNNLLALEKQCHSLRLENSNLEKKFVEVKNARKELDNLNHNLKVDFNDSRLEVESKNVCIKQLKEKIAEQFVEIQMLTKSKNLTAQTLNGVNTELEHLKKMLIWYKNQLSCVQDEKKCLLSDVTQCRLESLSKNEKINLLTSELKCKENKFKLYQLEVLKEKQKLYEELNESKISTGLCEIKQEINQKDDQSVLMAYENSIEDFKKEIASIKGYMSKQDEIIKKMNKENSGLVSRCVTTQKLLQNKNLELEEFDLSRRQLILEMNLLKDEHLKEKNEIDALKTEKMKLESEVLCCKEEKEFVDLSIRTVRDQFAAFVSQHNKLKGEMVHKNKQILNLENEKQELFMENNWKLCELEKVKMKDIEINKLNNIVDKKEQIIHDYSNKIKLLEDKLKQTNEVSNAVVGEHKKEIERYDKVLIEYNEMIGEYEMKIKNLEETIAATKFLTNDLKDNLNIIKIELKKRDEEIYELKDVNQKLLIKNQKLESKNNVSNLDKEVNTDCFTFELKTVTKVDQAVQNEDLLNVCEENKIQTKVEKFKIRLKTLENSISENKKQLNVLEIEKIVSEKEKNDLKALLQVKELELNEKQKKYERIYRTLLRKVREHMKGRNSAEKHNKYLQDVYNGMSDKNNSLTLSRCSKIYEQDENKKFLTDLINNNEKLKKESLEIEKRVEICKKCVEFDAIEDRVENSEDIKIEKQNFKQSTIELENLVLQLQEKIHDLQCQIDQLNNEKNYCLKEIQHFQSIQTNFLFEKENVLKQLKDAQLNIEDLNKEMEENKRTSEEKSLEIFTLKNKLRETEDKLEFFTKEKETLSISLEACNIQLQFLQTECAKKHTSDSEQCEEHLKTIEEFKRSLQETHIELSSVNSERYFIQRLCNDLKVALKSQINQNQILKQNIDLLTKNNQDSVSSRSSLPDLHSLQSFDENFINNLLHETRVVPKDKPLTDIQLSLDTLRKEIFILQEQISKKNLRTA